VNYCTCTTYDLHWCGPHSTLWFGLNPERFTRLLAVESERAKHSAESIGVGKVACQHITSGKQSQRRPTSVNYSGHLQDSDLIYTPSSLPQIRACQGPLGRRIDSGERLAFKHCAASSYFCHGCQRDLVEEGVTE
jgi:hypothetical protein